MTPALAIQAGVGALAMLLGLPLLLAPARTARRFRFGSERAGAYGLRIAGMMLSMFGVLLVLFAVVVATAHIS